jgi:hypothetical protein
MVLSETNEKLFDFLHPRRVNIFAFVDNVCGQLCHVLVGG